jgi:hypothetical protein
MSQTVFDSRALPLLSARLFAPAADTIASAVRWKSNTVLETTSENDGTHIIGFGTDRVSVIFARAFPRELN